VKKSAEMRKEYGHGFDMLMAGRGVRVTDAMALAAKMKKEGMDVVDAVMDGEREALRRRYFFGPT